MALFKNIRTVLIIFLGIVNFFILMVFGSDMQSVRAKIVFLDVGQGDATLILAENDDQVLIDGGDGKRIMDELGKNMPFYDHTIELVVITHPDSDHAGGLIEVLKYYEVDEILQTRYSCDTQICKELDAVISEKGIKRRYAQFGQMIHAGDQSAEILHFGDAGTGASDDNNDSIVLKASINGKTILLMGDAGSLVESDLIRRGIDIDSDILKVSHHGSKSATSAEFIEKVSPQKAIISVGKNKYGHPSDDVLNRLKNVNIEVLRTDISGDVAVE